MGKYDNLEVICLCGPDKSCAEKFPGLPEGVHAFVPGAFSTGVKED